MIPDTSRLLSYQKLQCCHTSVVRDFILEFCCSFLFILIFRFKLKTYVSSLLTVFNYYRYHPKHRFQIHMVSTDGILKPVRSRANVQKIRLREGISLFTVHNDSCCHSSMCTFKPFKQGIFKLRFVVLYYSVLLLCADIYRKEKASLLNEIALITYRHKPAVWCW